MKLLIFLIIAIILWPIIMGWRFFSSVRRSVREVRRQAYGDNTSANRGYQQPEEPTQAGKVLSDVEEDAEWETVEGPATQQTQSTSSYTNYQEESQVTDAEFEEVK